MTIIVRCKYESEPNRCKSDEREDLPSWQYPEGRNDVVSTNQVDVKHPVTTYFEVEAVMLVTYIE